VVQSALTVTILKIKVMDLVKKVIQSQKAVKTLILTNTIPQFEVI